MEQRDLDALRKAAEQAQQFKYCCARCGHTIKVNTETWLGQRPYHEYCARAVR